MEYKIIQYAQNGAALKGIELSEEQSVIPEGALHKNKHHLDLEGITKKGIPVIQNVDDSVETLAEIK
jgi:predicted aconitase with swiveling domain